MSDYSREVTVAKFAWEGKTRGGEVQKGEMEAPSEVAVGSQLRRQGIMPTRIKERGKGLDVEIKIPGMGGKVSTKDLVVFTRQFATMIDAGLALVQCLDILGRQQENKEFKRVLVEVKESVESGSTFADALKKHPKAFDELSAKRGYDVREKLEDGFFRETFKHNR